MKWFEKEATISQLNMIIKLSNALGQPPIRMEQIEAMTVSEASEEIKILANLLNSRNKTKKRTPLTSEEEFLAR